MKKRILLLSSSPRRHGNSDRLCDEFLRGAREVVSMSVHTQIPLHRRFGGVVPELASRSHVEKVAP